jgi:tetratricopeptide (TPR) repeat protein
LRYLISIVLPSTFAQDFRQGNDFFKANNTNEAKSKYAEALHKLKLYEEEGDNVTEGAHTTVLSNIGALHFAEGRFIGAKALLAEAEKERAIAHGDRSLNNPCLLSLAIAIRHDIADRRVPSFQRNLESDVKEHSSIDSLTADLMNNLAACYEVGQDLEQARRFYAESLKLRKVRRLLRRQCEMSSLFAAFSLPASFLRINPFSPICLTSTGGVRGAQSEGGGGDAEPGHHPGRAGPHARGGGLPDEGARH